MAYQRRSFRDQYLKSLFLSGRPCICFLVWSRVCLGCRISLSCRLHHACKKSVYSIRFSFLSSPIASPPFILFRFPLYRFFYKLSYLPFFIFPLNRFSYKLISSPLIPFSNWSTGRLHTIPSAHLLSSSLYSIIILRWFSWRLLRPPPHSTSLHLSIGSPFQLLVYRLCMALSTNPHNRRRGKCKLIPAALSQAVCFPLPRWLWRARGGAVTGRAAVCVR